MGVELGTATATGDATALRVAWPVEVAPEGWLAPGFSASAQVDPLIEADPFATDVAAFPADPAVPPLAAPSTSGDTQALGAAIPLPREPGIYRVTVDLTDTRFGHAVASAGPFNLYVPAPRAWSFAVPAQQEIDPGGLVRISFVVANVGTESWVEPASEPGLSQAGETRPRNTRLVGTWVGPGGLYGYQDPAAAPPDVEFGPSTLEPGYTQSFDALIRVPAEAGLWHLVVRLVENGDGPSAFVGSAPGVMDFDVLDHDEVVAP